MMCGQSSLMKFPTEQGRLIQCHIFYDDGYPIRWIELVEGYFCQRNEGHANAPAVSEIHISPLFVAHKLHDRYALLIAMASGTFGSAWEGWCYLIWRKKRRQRAPFLVKGTFASLILLLFLSSAIAYVTNCSHHHIFRQISHYYNLALPTSGSIFPQQLCPSILCTPFPTIKD
jgi:hypothetical protein